jgi:hypothetical protein
VKEIVGIWEVTDEELGKRIGANAMATGRSVSKAEESRPWLVAAGAAVEALPEKSLDGTEWTNTHNNADLARLAERLHELAARFAPVPAAER